VAATPLTVVIGAGISGLACAYALQKAAQNVLVFEASARPGGVIQSVSQDGYLFELGPQSISSTPALDALCAELSLSDQLVTAPHSAPRYIVVDGRLMPVPTSPRAFLASGLLTWKTKFALLTEVVRTSRPPEADESIAAFTRRKFTPQLLERLVGPFVSGVYAGDPEQISLPAAFPKIHEAEKSAGSVVRGMMRTAKTAKATSPEKPARRRASLLSFSAGNETLVRGLADRLQSAPCCNVTVRAVTRKDQGFLLNVSSPQGSDEVSCARLVIATPTSAAADLLHQVASQAAPSLREISYAPVAVVSLGYRRDQVRHPLPGFGFLAPRSSGIQTLGTVWNSSLFPGRAPQDHVLLTSFVGGATNPAIAVLSPQELSSLVHTELASLLGINGQPHIERVARHSRAIPQYNLGHTTRLQSAQQAISSVSGLWVIGNYWKGPAVGACLEHALAVAEQVRISNSS